jgi:hypothetical protein
MLHFVIRFVYVCMLNKLVSVKHIVILNISRNIVISVIPIHKWLIKVTQSHEYLYIKLSLPSWLISRT